MFSKISRYKKLPDVVTVDARGRVLASKSLRLLPEVSGDFEHIVESGERLDHLGYKYYRQTRNWWQIADANPEFLSPFALVGKEDMQLAHVSVTWQGVHPAWSQALEELKNQPGVEHAAWGTLDHPRMQRTITQGALLVNIDPVLTTELDLSGTTQAVTTDLESALNANAIALSADLRITKQDAVTWIIEDLENTIAYLFIHFPDENLLNVYPGVFLYEWVLEVAFHARIESTSTLQSILEGLGFTSDQPLELQRVGKGIIIPPRSI